jgi:hypothetical protein
MRRPYVPYFSGEWVYGVAVSRIKVPVPVTVGAAIANRPPCRSMRAGLPDAWRRSARRDKDAGREAGYPPFEG